MNAKKGATAAPFFGGIQAAYRFLPPFFFAPPLAVFFAIALIPPFRRGIPMRGASTVAVRPLPSWHAGPARVGARRFFA
jgi:hypothetical protein